MTIKRDKFTLTRELSRRRMDVRLGNMQEWLVTEPDGTEHRVTNLKAWCQFKNVPYDTLRQYRACRGYTAERA